MFGQLFLAAFLGLVVGTERALVAKQSAGMRTFALVSLGACLFTLGGIAVGGQYLGYVNFDPTRVMSAIVQGVGFIGAGLMFVQGNSVHGITTAAGLWVSASLGVLVGIGFYSLAVFAAALTLLIFFGLWHIEHAFKNWYHNGANDE
jgi:putative Mg2+ transporter-C (MgtC) family protein